jgi:hypothetical protein
MVQCYRHFNINYMQSAQLMQNAIKASQSPPSSITGPILRKSFKTALEILEDSSTEGLVKSMCTLSGVTTEEELFSDYELYESSLHQLLGDETTNTIL